MAAAPPAQLHPFDTAWLLASHPAERAAAPAAALARGLGLLARSGAEDRGDALEVELLRARCLERVLELSRHAAQQRAEVALSVGSEGVSTLSLSREQMLADARVGPLLRTAAARGAAMDDAALTQPLVPATKPASQRPPVRRQPAPASALHRPPVPQPRQQQQQQQQQPRQQQQQPRQHQRHQPAERRDRDLGPAASAAPVDLSHLPGGNVASNDLWGGGSRSGGGGGGGARGGGRRPKQKQQAQPEPSDDERAEAPPRSNFMTGSAKLRIDDKKSGRKRTREGTGGSQGSGGQGSGGQGGERSVRGTFRPPTRPDEGGGAADAQQDEAEEEEVHELYRNIDPKYIEQIQNEVLERVPDVQWYGKRVFLRKTRLLRCHSIY
jgi:hypothetical protein